MRKLVLVTFFLSFAASIANLGYGQLKLGGRACVNLASASFDDSESSNLVGFAAGLVGEIDLSSRVYLRPELLYAVKGWKFTGGSTALHYLNVPLLFGYKPTPTLGIVAGGEFGYLLKAARNSQAAGVVNDYEKIDYGIVFGASYRIVENLAVDFRYIHGFKTMIIVEGRDVNNMPTGEVYRDGANRVFSIGLTYFFANKDQ